MNLWNKNSKVQINNKVTFLTKNWKLNQKVWIETKQQQQQKNKKQSFNQHELKRSPNLWNQIWKLNETFWIDNKLLVILNKTLKTKGHEIWQVEKRDGDIYGGMGIYMAGCGWNLM